MSAESEYIDDILHQRKAREERLISSPYNWFSLIGLFPLQDGANPVGNDPRYRINLAGLPDGATAIFMVNEQGVFLSTADSSFLVNGQPPPDRPLRQDVDGEPDLVEAGPIGIRIIHRLGRPFLRVWDREAQTLKEYKGLQYFPVEPKYRITAVYQSFDTPRSIQVLDAIGGEHETLFPGQAFFTIDGVECVLTAEDEGDGLLFNFTDLTRADTSYPGGRYLLTELPLDDSLIMDFNLTRNWPCAYTAFATCPLPLPDNHLKVRVAAGEMRYHD